MRPRVTTVHTESQKFPVGHPVVPPPPPPPPLPPPYKARLGMGFLAPKDSMYSFD